MVSTERAELGPGRANKDCPSTLHPSQQIESKQA